MLKGFVWGVFWWWFFAFGDLFFTPLFLLVSPAERDDFAFCAPFTFFRLAQQASCIFDGDFLIVSLFFFAPFYFLSFSRFSRERFCFYILIFCCFRKAEQILR
jgi:hypothetical protein